MSMIRMALYHSRPNHFYTTRRKLHNSFSPQPPNPTPCPTAYDWFNFFASCVHCSIIFSILWGFESHRDKIRMIEDTNLKINEIALAYKVLEKRCITKRRPVN